MIFYGSDGYYVLNEDKQPAIEAAQDFEDTCVGLDGEPCGFFVIDAEWREEEIASFSTEKEAEDFASAKIAEYGEFFGVRKVCGGYVVTVAGYVPDLRQP